ncbi:MAG TPA: hypothetical protein DCF63_05610 [Planctomycetaceae bacterium]|nr:hypothetical protein [Planctomycetaceae bacterium]
MHRTDRLNAVEQTCNTGLILLDGLDLDNELATKVTAQRFFNLRKIYRSGIRQNSLVQNSFIP